MTIYIIFQAVIFCLMKSEWNWIVTLGLVTLYWEYSASTGISQQVNIVKYHVLTRDTQSGSFDSSRHHVPDAIYIISKVYRVNAYY